MDTTRQDRKAREANIDALLNRARVSLARSQKLVEAWLPIGDNEQEVGADTNDTDGAFEIRPERAGLGADLSTLKVQPYGLLSTGTSLELEVLRKQMLGRKAMTNVRSKQPPGTGRVSDPSARPKRARKEMTPESDEEGRAASFRPRNVAPSFEAPGIHLDGSGAVPAVSGDETVCEEDDGVRGEAMDSGKERSRGRAPLSSASYLDEILAGRSRKRKGKAKQG